MRPRIYALAFIMLVLVYVGMIFALPLDSVLQERYQIAALHAKLLYLAIVLPFILIWFIALKGLINLQSYANSVAKTREGIAFQRLTIGLAVLTFSLPLTTIANSLRTYALTAHEDWLMYATIFRNYFALILSLAAFLLLFAGATALIQTLKRTPNTLIPRGLPAGLITLAAFYSWIITSEAFIGARGERMYYTPDGLLVFTIVVPYLIAWKAGILTAYYLQKYHNAVQGILYKNAFRDIGIGIGLVVTVSILIQLITTSTANFERVGLIPLLLIVYVLLTLYIIGFGMVGNGAKKLKKLEDV